MTYEGYLSKRSKHIPTDSYLYLERQLANFMMINLCGLVRTKTTSTQNMSNSHGLVRTQIFETVCSTEKIKLKGLIPSNHSVLWTRSD